MKHSLQGLTVRELIEQLQQVENQDLVVCFEHPSHDYWKSTLTTPASELVEAEAQWSDYHSQFTAVDEDLEDEKREAMDERGELYPCVVLRS